jgi:hypothetical protein
LNSALHTCWAGVPSLESLWQPHISPYFYPVVLDSFPNKLYYYFHQKKKERKDSHSILEKSPRDRCITPRARREVWGLLRGLERALKAWIAQCRGYRAWRVKVKHSLPCPCCSGWDKALLSWCVQSFGYGTVRGGPAPTVLLPSAPTPGPAEEEAPQRHPVG